MKKLRDLIYDYNDIFVALLIIAAAAAVILWRVGAIMDYPDYIASKSDQGLDIVANIDDVDLTQEEVEDFNTNPDEITTETPAGTESPTTETPAVVEEPTSEPEQTPASTPTPTPVVETPKNVSFTIPSGSSASKIVDLLFQAGLINDKDAFLKTLKEKGADRKLKAGSFEIPSGSSFDEIISILTD